MIFITFCDEDGLLKKEAVLQPWFFSMSVSKLPALVRIPVPHIIPNACCLVFFLDFEAVEQMINIPLTGSPNATKITEDL